jgi:hypothetical protein
VGCPAEGFLVSIANMTMLNTRTLLLVAVGLGFVPVGRTADPADPILGTWKLNFEKSKLPTQLADLLTSEVKTLEAPAPDTIRATAVFTLRGKEGRVVNTLFIDGKDHPANGRFGATMSNTTGNIERPDQRHINAVFKMDGKLFTTMSWTVSEDGKTLTEFRIHPDGQRETDILERQ